MNFEDTSVFRVHFPFLYCKKIVEVLRKKIVLTSKKDTTFHPVQKNRVVTLPMKNIYIQKRFRVVKRREISSSYKGLFWNENTGDLLKIFVGLVQINSKKTAKNLKENYFLAYAIHKVFLNRSLSHSRFMIANGYKTVGFLPDRRKEYFIFEEEVNG